MSGAETSTSAPNDADLFDKGLLCPHAHYFCGEPGEYDAFCQKYNIPDDVFLHRVKSSEKRDKRGDHPEHIIVPLMAICEAGLRSPSILSLGRFFGSSAWLPISWPSTVTE